MLYLFKKKVRFEDRKWYFAKILEKMADSQKQEKTETKENNKILIKKLPVYRVLFLNEKQEWITNIMNIRTYVCPLPSQLQIGQKVKAIWMKDNRFYPSTIIEILENKAFNDSSTDATIYRVKYDKYDEYGLVNIYDIQLIKERKLWNQTIISKSKNGDLIIADKLEIPKHLWSTTDDTINDRERKRKKIRSMKKQYRTMKCDVQSRNRANSWKKFQTKSIKKSKKKLNGNMINNHRSIFTTDGVSNSGMVNSGVNFDGSMILNTPKMTKFEVRTHFHHLRKDPKEYQNQDGNY